ncbi:glutathione S-transferase [Paraphysoderma sedebokerense]|nr:glutathione S-transferase [Paraphysoderma sedebokerense]
MSPSLKLYFARMCPFAQRTTLVLAELGFIKSIYDFSGNSKDLELVPIDLANKPDWYFKVNPKGTVPTLELLNVKDQQDPSKNQLLFESILIAQYFAEEYSSVKRLIPESPLEKYQMRYVAEQFSSSFVPSFYSLLRAQGAEKQSEGKQAFLKTILQINDLLKSTSAGPYILGDKFTIGDVILSTFIARLPVLKHFRDFDIPRDEKYQRFNSLVDAVMNRDSVKNTLASMDELIAGYKPFADGTK